MADFSRFETEFDTTRSFMHYDSVRVPAPTAKRYSEQTAHGSGLTGPSLLFKYGSGQPALSVPANSPIWQSACNRLAHGMGRGIRRARQFDERSNSLAPRDFFSPCLSWAVAEPLARFRHSPLHQAYPKASHRFWPAGVVCVHAASVRRALFRAYPAETATS